MVGPFADLHGKQTEMTAVRISETEDLSPFGPFRAVLLDWAGTATDYGSRGPTQVFIEVFRRRGVEITESEARGPMGLSKREHIAAVLALPRINTLWQRSYGPATEDDVQRMYEEFLPLQKETLKAHSDVIPGVAAAIAELRSRGLRIGSSTGYTRELMDVVCPLAAAGGYEPDVVVCSDEVPAGRPTPWMNRRAAELLGVTEPHEILVVDDTPVGIAAGRAFGALTIAVSRTGNALGLSLPDIDMLPSEELTTRLQTIESDFLSHGAHAVIQCTADLPQLLQMLESSGRCRTA